MVLPCCSNFWWVEDSMRVNAKAMFIAGLVTVLIVACGEKDGSRESAASLEPYVVAVNNPLRYFCQRLLGDELQVRMLAPDDVDPASWQPTLENVIEMQGAELVFLNGAGYSSWVEKVSLAAQKQVVTSIDAAGKWIQLDNQPSHSHGPGGEHVHGAYAFTTWMDLSLAAEQAREVASALQERWPEHSKSIAANLQTLETDLAEVDRGYQRQALRLAELQIVYSHPVFQYFERRYQLAGTSLHWEPDVMPSAEQWRQLAQNVSAKRLFIWEADPGPAITDRLTALGVSYTVVAPAANRGDEDWLEIQRANIVRLSEVRP